MMVEESTARVVLKGVECLGFLRDQQKHRLEKADVVFHTTSPEGQNSSAKTVKGK